MTTNMKSLSKQEMMNRFSYKTFNNFMSVLRAIISLKIVVLKRKLRVYLSLILRELEV